MKTEFEINHDDHFPFVIDEISGILEQFGLKIILIDSCDGWEKYEIVKITDTKDEKDADEKTSKGMTRDDLLNTYFP